MRVRAEPCVGKALRSYVCSTRMRRDASSWTTNLYDELKRRLSLDFLAGNLDFAATLAYELSWNAPRPLGLFVVTRVLRVLAEAWRVDDEGDQAAMTTDALAFM